MSSPLMWSHLFILWLFHAALAADYTYITSTNTQAGLVGWELVFGNTTQGICSGEGYVSSISFGSWYFYRFRGTNVTAYILQAPDAAQLEVFIDDVFQTRISSYNPSVTDVNSCTLYQYNSPILPYAQHVITLYHNGAPPERPNSTVYMRINKFIHTSPDNATLPSSTSQPIFTPSAPLFTMSTSTPSTSSTSSSATATAAASSAPTGAIVGGVVGGILAVGVMILIIILVLRKRNSQPKQPPPNMVYTQNHGQGVDLGGGMQAPTVTPLVLPAQHQGQMAAGPPTAYSNNSNYNHPGQQYQPYTFAAEPQAPQAPPALPNAPTNQYHNDATPPFNPYYHSGASTTAASTSSPPALSHTSSSDEKAGARRQMLTTVGGDSRNRSLTSLAATTSPFPLPSDTSNRLSTRQLDTIQQMVERGVPASTVAAVVENMLNPRQDQHSPTSGAPPPAYVPTAKQ